MKTSSTLGPKTIVYYAVYHNCICVGVFNYVEFSRLVHSYFIFVYVFYLQIEFYSKLLRLERIKFHFPVRSDKIWFVFAIFRAILYQTDFRLIPNHLGGCKYNLVMFSLEKARNFLNQLVNLSDISIELDYPTVYRKCSFRPVLFTYNLLVEFQCLMQLYFCFHNSNVISNEFLVPIRSDKIWVAFTIFRLIWYQTDFRLIPNRLEGCKCNHVPSSLTKLETSFLNYLKNSSDFSIKLVYLTIYQKCFFPLVVFTYNLPVEFHCLIQLCSCFYNSSVIFNEFLFPIRSDEICVAFAIFRLIWYRTDFRLITDHLGDCRCNWVPFSLVEATSDFYNFVRKSLGDFIDFHCNLRHVAYPDFWKNCLFHVKYDKKLNLHSKCIS